jgi:hypothetical protein
VLLHGLVALGDLLGAQRLGVRNLPEESSEGGHAPGAGVAGGLDQLAAAG